ncbi:MAG: bifunctional hydroxymethylpyrimidine kinase/phosphomethylpyrimidine kinase, partial [Tetragenococcus koreensis]|nr:bifunctional hydroxymethylpyrimidine kinase/phosphomethylpyrimidine kinase [Tetragenococcus koreensis]
LYPGLSEELIEASRLMAIEADMIIPNFTEFSLIVGKKYPTTDELNHSLVVTWLEKARDKGVQSAVITSVQIEDQYYVYGYSKKENIFRVKVDYVPVEVGGSGDIFTSLILGRYPEDYNLKKTFEYATTVLTNIIRAEYKKNKTKEVNEIEIQNHLQHIYNSIQD